MALPTGTGALAVSPEVVVSVYVHVPFVTAVEAK